MKILGQEINKVGNSVEINIKEEFHSAYKIFGYTKSNSFGVNVGIINHAKDNGLYLVINCRGIKFKANPDDIINFVIKYNTFMRKNGVNIMVFSQKICEEVV